MGRASGCPVRPSLSRGRAGNIAGPGPSGTGKEDPLNLVRPSPAIPAGRPVSAPLCKRAAPGPGDLTPARGPPPPLAPRPGSDLSLQAAEAPDPGAHTRAPGSPGPPRLGRPHPGRPRPAPPPYRLAPARQPAGLALVRHRLATRSPVRLRPGPPSSRHPARLASAGLASAGLAPARLVQVRHRLVIRAGLAPVRHPVTSPASPRPASPRSATVSPAGRLGPGPPPGPPRAGLPPSRNPVTGPASPGLATAGLAPVRHRLPTLPASPRSATVSPPCRPHPGPPPGHQSGPPRAGLPPPRHPAGLAAVRHRLATRSALPRPATRLASPRPASPMPATHTPYLTSLPVLQYTDFRLQ